MPASALHAHLASLDFHAAITRDAAWNPVVDAEFTAEQGNRVLIVDVRAYEELTGPLGYIPTSVHVPLARVSDLVRLGPRARLVLVSKDGRRAAIAARLLELCGLTTAAALEGGLLAWRAAGLPCTREAQGIVSDLPADVDAILDSPVRPDGPLDLHELRAHVSVKHRIRWMKLAAFLLNGRTACVDGRDSQGVVGAPGGDAGEMALALAAAEAHGVTLDDATVDGLLRGWVESFGRFYLHSDIHALQHLIQTLSADPEVPVGVLPKPDASALEWRRFTASPPPELRPVLLRHLTAPANIGCGHLRMSILHGQAYGVRPALVQSVLRAFFLARWDGLPELEYVSLGGGHQEGAVLVVRLEGEIQPYTHIPLVPPAIGDVQMFVAHPQVSAYQRAEVAHWLCHRPELPALHGRWEALTETLHRLGDRQLNATLSRLAPGLPMYEAVFTPDREVRVSLLGPVPGDAHEAIPM
jgi:rhodanese-related sulfurtransferase